MSDITRRVTVLETINDGVARLDIEIDGPSPLWALGAVTAATSMISQAYGVQNQTVSFQSATQE